MLHDPLSALDKHLPCFLNVGNQLLTNLDHKRFDGLDNLRHLYVEVLLYLVPSFDAATSLMG